MTQIINIFALEKDRRFANTLTAILAGPGCRVQQKANAFAFEGIAQAEILVWGRWGLETICDWLKLFDRDIVEGRTRSLTVIAISDLRHPFLLYLRRCGAFLPSHIDWAIRLASSGSSDANFNAAPISDQTLTCLLANALWHRRKPNEHLKRKLKHILPEL